MQTNNNYNFMKKLTIIPIFLALFASACSTGGDEVTDDPQVEVPTSLTQVTATIDTSTRASALINANDDFAAYWSSSDKILITDLAKSATFSIKSGQGSVTATFTGSFEPSKEVLYAAHPATSASMASGKVSLKIPTEQNYAPARGTDLKDKVVMLGQFNDNNSFTFTPAAAIVRFNITLPAERTIRSVTVNSQGVAVAGNGVADFEQGMITNLSSKSLTLNYTSPSKGTSKDGWATIAAADFKSATGNVTYEILTDLGVYTFCYNPDQKFKAGEVYSIDLSVESFSEVHDLEKIKHGEYYYNLSSSIPEPEPDPEPEVDSKLNVRAVRVTDSTITIGWTITSSNVPFLDQIIPHKDGNYATDITKEYKVALYRDAACTDLVVSVEPIKDNLYDKKALFIDNLCPPRFVFPGLAPATTYYAKVTNITDNYSNATPVQITTKAPIANKNNVVKSNAKAGDMIVFENFAGLVYAGEVTSRGAGVSRTDRNTLQDFNGVGVTGAITATASGYYMVNAGTEIGLFNTLKGLVDEMGVSDWGWIGGKSGANGGSICARAGYVKIGTSSNRSFICTPVLNAIPTGKVANLKVVFKAAPYGSEAEETVRDDERYLAVKALSRASLGSDYAMSYKDVVDEKSITLEGNSVSDWKEYTVTLTGVPSGSSIALGGALAATTTNRMFLDDIRVYVESLEDAPAVPIATGKILYSDGTPAAGVSVSDGFSVVTTAADGSYTLDPHQDAYYIYYSIPEDCQVPINEYGQPAFFKKYSTTQNTYNFTLTKLDGGKESKFALFCLADPQCKDATHRNRFNNEAVPDIKAHASTKGVPCYGVTLGDVTYSEGSRNCEAQMPYLRGHMAKSNIGMPIFQTMGNHDYTFFSSSSPISADDGSSTYNLKAQRKFEECFGPIDYSWNRGDAHIVCMRNMQWNKNTDAADYTMKFTNEQYEWLRQDLANVPKDKLVIFCVHIPLTNSSNTNVQKVISLLKQFKEAHIMSGHTHYMRNEPTLSGGIYEHVHAAVCGTWWYSRVNGDGAPNGYGVYDIEGATIKNWYYKGQNTSMNDRDYQIRLYPGDLQCGGTHETIQLQHGNGVLLANVFNADSKWTVKVYEDGTYAGDMKMISFKKEAPTAGSPTKPSTTSSQDWWAIGYHIGVVGRGHVGGNRANYLTSCFHMYKYTLKNKNAKVRVEATDRFGRTYSATELTTDYSIMSK